MTKKNTSTPPKMTATKKKNGKSGSKCQKKTKSVQRHHFVGVRIISVVFHRIERVFFIVDGLFVGVIVFVVVCCIQDVISFVNDIEHQEKTRLRQPGQPESTQEEGPHIKSMMKQEPKLAAYNVDGFNSTSTKNECLKHPSNKNLPVTQEGQLTFLLDKYHYQR
jgi:hypothetical protein